MTARNIEHEKLCDDLLFVFGSRPDIRAWGRDVGFDSVKKVSYGIKGECDIEMIVAPFGIMCGIEVKTGSGKLNKDQERWRDMIIKFGGIYIEARSVEQAKNAFEGKLAEWLLNYKNRLASWEKNYVGFQ